MAAFEFKYEPPAVGRAARTSFERLREFCRVPENESGELRSIRSAQQLAELDELFSSDIAQSKRGLADLFRMMDSLEDRPVLEAARNYLRLKLGRLEKKMSKHLAQVDDFDPVLRAQMEVIAASEIMLSRPAVMKPMTPKEVKESLAGFTIPRKYLNGGRGYHSVENSLRWNALLGEDVFHVCHVSCGEQL